MNRYKPKLPIYGGSMAKKKKEEFGKGFKTKQMLGGGPVERAIQQDLIGLLQRFQKMLHQDDHQRCHSRRLSSSQMAMTSPLEIMNRKEHVEEHKLDGYTFQLFKNIYKDTKFGIIFTRAVPPRSEHDQFVQLIYSAALSFLKDAFDEKIGGNEEYDKEREEEELQQDGGDIGGRTNDYEHNLFFKASFAMYALYTLYKTNPAPQIPQNDNYMNKKSSTEPSMTNNNGQNSSSISSTSLSTTEMRQLSTLPLFEKNNIRMYRRSYHSPIRISFECMQLVMKTRHKSLDVINKCQESRCAYLIYLQQQQHQEKENCVDHEISLENNNKPFICKCSLARDCASLIDRLIYEQCFCYCEYNGPVSVEGWCGSDEYVRENVFDETRKKPITAVVHDEKDDNDNELNNTILEYCDSSDAILDSLDLDQIQQTMRNYQNTMGKVATDLRQKVSSNQSRNKNQIVSIQKTIDPILKEVTRRRNDNVCNQIESILDSNSKNDKRGKERRVHFTTTSRIENTSSNSNANDNEQIEGQRSSNRTEINVMYPSSFSKGLQVGISKALKTLVPFDNQEKSLETRPVVKRGFFFDVEEELLDELADYAVDYDGESVATFESSDIVGSGNVALALLLNSAMVIANDNVPKRPMKTFAPRQKRQSKNDMSSHSSDGSGDEVSISMESEMSFATNMSINGSGNDALTELLQKATQPQSAPSRSKKSSKRQGGRKSKSHIFAALQVSSQKEEIDDDDNSRSSQGDVDSNSIGNIALKELLQNASQSKQFQNKPKKTRIEEKKLKNFSTLFRVDNDSGSNYNEGGINYDAAQSIDVNDEASVQSKFSIVESGKDALSQLLQQVLHEKEGMKRKRSTKNNKLFKAAKKR
jgi:hypothetical protein